MPPGDYGWAVAFLRGRVSAYRRGKISRQQVAGAVRMALNRSISLSDIRMVLAEGGLDWDSDADVLRDSRE